MNPRNILLMQQNVLRQIGWLAKARTAGQQRRATDGKELFSHQQIAAQPVESSATVTNGYIDPLAREIGERRRSDQAHIDVIALDETPETRNEPARNDGRAGAHGQYLCRFAPLQIGRCLGKFVEQSFTRAR